MSQYCHNCMRPVEEGCATCPHCGRPAVTLNAIHQLAPGTVLQGRYLIGRALGQGGFGITYIGRDTLLNLRIAVKEYYPNGCSYRDHDVTDMVTITTMDKEVYHKGKRRFLQEAQTLARFIDEPGIVSVHDYFEGNNTAYIVMEYVDGVTLKSAVKTGGRLSADTLLPMMKPLIEALEKVHAQGIIHRDISPENIIWLMNKKLKLLDFGAAREVSGDKSLSVMLKPGYAPEEQYRSKGRQGPWTDIYALCATMYYCLTGIRPEESVERAMNPGNRLKRPSELGATISPAQESAILRGMAIQANERYQTMQELCDALYGEEKPQSRSNYEIYAKPAARKPYNEEGYNARPSYREPLKKERQDRFSTESERRPYIEKEKKLRRLGKTLMRWLLALIGVAILTAGAVFAYQYINSRKAEQSENTDMPMDAVEMFRRGLSYENGDGIGQDYLEAMTWYTKAAEAGNADAMNNIGYMYENGRGIERDVSTAMDWYRKAAELGNSSAMSNIGALYYTGTGVEQDYQAAMNWFLRSAENGNTEVLYLIGSMFDKGLGVPKDMEKATEYYTKAAENGDSEAAARLEQLQSEDYVEMSDLLTGEWGSTEAIYNGTTVVFYLDDPVYNCTGLTMSLRIDSYTGYPFAEWYLYAQNMNGEWSPVTQFRINKEQGDGRTVRYDFSFDSPQSFRALTICPAEDGMEFKMTRELLFYQKQH